MTKAKSVVLAAAIAGIGLTGPAYAQETLARTAALGDTAEAVLTVEEVDQKLRILQRQLELEREAATAARATAATTTVSAGGVQFRVPDGSFQLRLRGYIHEDGRFFADSDPTGTSTFLLRRVRPIIEGTVFRHYDFRLMTDFGGGTTVLQDAYVDVNHVPQARIRLGKFKPPVGLERLQSATGILFAERALPTNLVPNRDIGVQVWADLAGGAVSYAFGVFNGIVDGGSGDADVNSGKDVAGRLFVTPLRATGIAAFQNLGVGIAASTGSQADATPTATGLGAQRSPIQQSIFTYRSNGQAAGTVLADGRRTRLSPQGYWYFGPVGLLGEYVTSRNEVRLESREAELTHSAWQLAGSYVLTGEAAAFAGVRPAAALDPKNGAWGALELKARVHALDLDEETFPTFADPARSVADARAWAVGLNWHLNQNVKLVLDYEHTEFDGGAAAGADRHVEQGILTRLQLAF